MAQRRDLTKEEVKMAMSQTLSNRSAARYLNCSYQHYRKWAQFYESDKPGCKTLWDEHKNQSGKGIPKFLSGRGKEPALKEMIEGRVDISAFDPAKIKYRLVTEGYLKDECYNCGFHERRVLDYKSPLLIHFKDKNKKNYRKENIELLCYNCYYLFVGDLFSEKQIKGIEDYRTVYQSEVKWDLDDYTKERLSDLGLDESEDSNELDSLFPSI